MIRFNLSKLLEKLEAAKGRKYTLKEVSERSGCDKNALSRMANHPEIVPSAKVIDELVQFFFFELTRDEKKPHLDRNRIRSVIKDFVSVFPDPDNEEFWSVIPPEIRNNPKVTLDDIWSIYTRAKTPEKPKQAAKLSEIKSSLKAKILEADASKQEGNEIELSLTPEEFELLRENLPQNIGGKS
jgi:transcriptional regulator with XRE-family HTH domain